ncbi:MAG TPA: tetratricopeptide repeat protein [Terriglobales bacterium]|nr:tetratricopeptide repeat protein [Terriglobales bacterium]
MPAGLIVLLVLALAPAGAYNEGNRLYAQRDYAGAARAYQRALAAGPNAAACYNLGNALFKSGKMGMAIVQYRRALALRPRDADVARNLSFARAYRVDKVTPDRGSIERALDRSFRLLSRREAAPAAAALVLLAALSLSVWIVRRGRWLLGAATALAVLALFCLVTQWVWTGEVQSRPAVVVVPEVDVLSGPGEEFKQILLIHDGTEVKVREQRGAYLLVQLSGGSGGWIRSDEVQRVY